MTEGAALNIFSTFETVHVVLVIGMFFCIGLLTILSHLRRRDEQIRRHEAIKHMEWKETQSIIEEASRHNHERALQLDDRKRALEHNRIPERNT